MTFEKANDILQEAEELLKYLNNDKSYAREIAFINEAATEIKRLREIERFYNSQKQEIKEFCRIIDDGYDSLVCNRTGLNEQQDLPEGIRRMAEQLAAKDSKIESLRDDNIALDTIRKQALGEFNLKIIECNDLMANCNQLRERCWKAEGKLTRWQKIAIEERALRLALL